MGTIRTRRRRKGRRTARSQRWAREQERATVVYFDGPRINKPPPKWPGL